MQCECKKCGTQFSHSSGRIRCPNCGSNKVWIIGGVGGIMILTVLLAIVLAVAGFLVLPADTFRAELFALIVAIPVVGVRFWVWRKPGTR